MPPIRTYFPDGPLLQLGVSHSPVTQPNPMHGPDNIQLMQTAPDAPRQSDEQGVGRSPGQRWPHMPHVEQYSYASLSNESWHVTDALATRPERGGWAAPVFYEQAVSQHHVFPVPIIIGEAGTQTYSGLSEVPA